MSKLKSKLKQDSWFYSHSGHCLLGGNLMRCLPQVFACYLFTMDNFSPLYRSSTMSEFEFFMGRVDRWGDSMRVLWGSLGICPPIDHIGLPCHTAEELYSISCLKVWGDVQKLHYGMAYLLVQIDDISEAETYGMALVWISPLQARVSLMVEALEILSSLTSEGSDWPYIFLQLYEGTNHMPLPKDKHICILPQEKAESLSGWISQLKICQLLSAGLLVVFPIELNWGNQSETINLPESLHTGSSITTDEYPYIEVSISMPIPEEQDHASLPLGRKHDIPTINWPKTPLKPRVTLTAEVNDLLDQGMMDNYDQELEHSAMEEVPATEADASPLEDGYHSSTIRYLLSGKCCRDGGLWGKQPHLHFNNSSYL